MSGKRLEYIFWGIVLFVLGIFFAGLGLSFISLITNELYGWFGKTIFVIIGIAILGVAYGIMRLSLFSFAGKSGWFQIYIVILFCISTEMTRIRMNLLK